MTTTVLTFPAMLRLSFKNRTSDKQVVLHVRHKRQVWRRQVPACQISWLNICKYQITQEVLHSKASQMKDIAYSVGCLDLTAYTTRKVWCYISLLTPSAGPQVLYCCLQHPKLLNLYLVTKAIRNCSSISFFFFYTILQFWRHTLMC